MNQLWHIHTMELLGNEIGHATDVRAWMNLTDVMLSGRSHTQKSAHCVIPFL